MIKALPKQDVLVEVVDDGTGIFVWLDNPGAYTDQIRGVHGISWVERSGKSLIMLNHDRRFDIEEVAQEIRDLLKPEPECPF
jgi:hypothetical protein